METIFFWDPFCVCGIRAYECSQMCGHTCKYRYTCNCMCLCMSMFVADRGCHLVLFLSLSALYFEEDSWLNSDPLDFTNLTHHRVPNRVPPESWDYRSASILAYCLWEGWRPECQTSFFDVKYFNYWDIPQPLFLALFL